MFTQLIPLSSYGHKANIWLNIHFDTLESEDKSICLEIIASKGGNS